MLPNVQRISNRILEIDNFENVAHVCCDWEEFVFEVAEWGVQSIAKVDFDSLTPVSYTHLTLPTNRERTLSENWISVFRTGVWFLW